MKNLNLLDRFRITVDHYQSSGDDMNGAFVIPFNGATLRVIASTGEGWEHVSVSLENRVPTYDEMVHIAGLFFRDHEMAIQYRMPVEDHINIHPYVLHWWRPQNKKIPTPPKHHV
jgi:hypothetical protein